MLPPLISELNSTASAVLTWSKSMGLIHPPSKISLPISARICPSGKPPNILCLAQTGPNNKITGGKVFLSHTPTSKNKANKALRLAAFSLANAKCALGAFYRRIRAKYGAPMANIATAHKLARIIYKMLKDKVEYRDPGEDYYYEKFKVRLIRTLKDKASSLGLQLIPAPTQ